MDIRKYEALQQVVELGSFSKAAEALGYTQSAVSQMVSSLEGELGFRLVERDRTGARLTPEGRRLYPYVERVTAQERAVQEVANEINDLDAGLVRIGSLTCISNCWLPRLVRDFEERYPEVRFEIRQGDYTQVGEWVRSGIVDFGFVNPAVAGGLETMPVKEGPMLAALPASHPLAQHDTVPLEILAQERLILLEEGCHNEPLAAFEQVGLHPQVRYRIHDAFAIMSMVEAGLGVGILAKMLLERQSYAIELRPCDPPVTRPIAAVFREWDALPIASRRFLDLVRDSAEKLA